MSPTSESETKFDIKQFNSNFDAFKKKASAQSKFADQEALQKLNDQANPPHVPLYMKTTGEIMTGIRNTWFEVLDDILQKKWSMDILTTGDRMFYIGITCVVIGLLLYLLTSLVDDEIVPIKHETIEKHYFYTQNKTNNVNKTKPNPINTNKINPIANNETNIDNAVNANGPEHQ